MNREEPNVLVALPRSPIGQAASRTFCMTINGEALRREMHRRGLTCRELARRAKVAPGTVSRAVNGGRLHPAKVRAIRIALNELEPLAGLDSLILPDSSVSWTDERGVAE